MTDSDLYEIEIALELAAVDDGKVRYQKHRQVAGESATPVGRSALARSMAPMIEAVKAEIEQTQTGKPGRRSTAVKLMTLAEPQVLAFLTAKVVLDTMMQNKPLAKAAIDLVRFIKDEVDAKNLREQEPGLARYLDTRIRKTVTIIGKKKMFAGALRQANVEKVQWTQTDRLKFGLKLIELFIQTTGIARIVRRTIAKHDTPLFLEATEQTQEWFTGAHAHAELLTPIFRPMVVPPTPWTTPFDGGYLTKRPEGWNFVRTHLREYLEELSSPDIIEQMKPVYDAVNAIQATPWRINKRVLEVMRTLFAEGSRLGGLPPAEDIPLPEKPVDIETNKVALQEWKRKAGRVHEINAARPAQWRAATAYIRTAEEFAQYERIYFPHTLDWRGRIYPMPSYLTPQGDDRCRGLLEFAEGQPLGENGAYWLAVHIANCYGVDKVSFDDRVQWTLDHEEEILDSALDPLDGRRFWSEAEDPWQALAACFEWAGYKVQGDEYISHLPISMDGTCNGLQHLSAMLKDPVGGAATNLVPADKPADIYSEVAKVAQARVDSAAQEGDEEAQQWVGKISRKVAKRPVMTMPYGASKFGMGEQIKAVLDKAIKDDEPILTGDTYKHAKYAAGVMYESIGEVVKAARVAMDWLQEVARIAASNNLPIAWTNPAGLPCLQAYLKRQSKCVNTFVGGVRFQPRIDERIEGQMDTRRMANGISPNFVHSMDAAHLCATVNRLTGRGVGSVNHFGMIHDSYAVHACNVDTLHHELRAAFVEQYSVNVLEVFREQIIEQLPEEKRSEVPPVPPMGTLDLSQVMDSQYFFA